MLEDEDFFTYYVIDGDYIALCPDCFLASVEDGIFNGDSFHIEYADHFMCDVCN